MNQGLNLLIAFGGGLLAFLSPCFLPLVPAYLIYITGLTFDELKDVRFKTIVHSLLFILGFTLVFAPLGLAVSALGGILFMFKDLLRIIGGGLIIFLGFYLAGIIRFGFLDVEKKITLSERPAGYLGTVFVGMVFALGWSPCVGPILASVLLVASQADRAIEGLWLLLAFSLGLGTPLFLLSLATNYSLSLLRKLQSYLPRIHFYTGVFLVIVGVMLVTDYFKVISAWLINITGWQGI